MRKSLTKFGWNFECWALQKRANLLDLVKNFPTSIYLHNSASIPRPMYTKENQIASPAQPAMRSVFSQIFKFLKFSKRTWLPAQPSPSNQPWGTFLPNFQIFQTFKFLKFSRFLKFSIFEKLWILEFRPAPSQPSRRSLNFSEGRNRPVRPAFRNRPETDRTVPRRATGS